MPVMTILLWVAAPVLLTVIIALLWRKPGEFEAAHRRERATEALSHLVPRESDPLVQHVALDRDRMDTSVLQAVKDLLTELGTALDQAEVDDAIGWTVICIDEQYGHLTANGVFKSREEADVAANDVRASVNIARDDAGGWTVLAIPVHEYIASQAHA